MLLHCWHHHDSDCFLVAFLCALKGNPLLCAAAAASVWLWHHDPNPLLLLLLALLLGGCRLALALTDTSASSLQGKATIITPSFVPNMAN